MPKNKFRSRLTMALGTLGLALAGIAAGAAPAHATGQGVPAQPSCSVRTLADLVTAEASCVNQNFLYEYRVTIFCKINMAEGYFWDYAVVSEWQLTTVPIRVRCDSGGALIVGTYGPEVRPQGQWI
jgi:hypothetical protein